MNMVLNFNRHIIYLLIVAGLAACHIEVEKNLNVTPPDSIQTCTTDVLDAVLDEDIDFIIENWDERWRDYVTVAQTKRVISTLYKDSFDTKPQRVSTQRGSEKEDKSYYTLYHIPHELGRDEITIGTYEDEEGDCVITNLNINFNTDKPFNALKKPQKRVE